MLGGCGLLGSGVRESRATSVDETSRTRERGVEDEEEEKF